MPILYGQIKYNFLTHLDYLTDLFFITLVFLKWGHAVA
jgi:hypothetical protein